MIHAVVATARGGAIGLKGTLPWPAMREDLAHFRDLTMGTGKAVIMGRRTWESLPEQHRPLQGRMNIVVSRTLTTLHRAHVVASVEEALGLAQVQRRTPYIIGGAKIYEAARSFVDRWHVTEIDRDVQADTRFFIGDLPVIASRDGATPGLRFVTLRGC